MVRLRMKPVLWDEVPADGFNVGEEIEIRSNWGKNDPDLATIREMTWSQYHGGIRYLVRQRGMEVAREFTAEDFLPLDDERRKAPGWI